MNARAFAAINQLELAVEASIKALALGEMTATARNLSDRWKDAYPFIQATPELIENEKEKEK